MIQMHNVSCRYPRCKINAIQRIDLHIRKGECVVLAGGSGCGKSTLIKMLNGLIPNLQEADVSGEIYIDAQSLADKKSWELTQYIGTVNQNPRSQFFTNNTKTELAFAMENLGWPRERILSRLGTLIKETDIAALMDRPILHLSSGERPLAAVAILPLGTVGYLLSNGIFGLLGGIVFVFICSKISARGSMTVFFAVLLLAISSLGGAYLPFIISTMMTAVLADLLLLWLGHTRPIAQYIAWPLMQVGILFGTMVPVWLFTQSFSDVFIEKGSSAAYVADQIHYSQGGWAAASIAFTVMLSVMGVRIARKILKKYLPSQEEL